MVFFCVLFYFVVGERWMYKGATELAREIEICFLLFTIQGMYCYTSCVLILRHTCAYACVRVYAEM